jgi:hypothetical protein
MLLLLSGLIHIRKTAGRGLLRAMLFPIGFWLIVAHLPTTPKHDGIRQLLSIYPFLGLMSWLGLMGWQEKLNQSPRLPGRRLLQIISVPAILIMLALGVYRCHPFELSYYNALIGGIRGAEEKGFELTYYLEAITPGFIKRLDPYLDNARTVYLMPPWPLLLNQYAQHGVLTGNFSVATLGTGATIDYLLILRRRGYVSDALYKAVTPLEEVTYNGVSLVKFYESPNRLKNQKN